ncbi:MAG: metalloregulator ArsR/SmtB family transcription factor [Candidatus Bathyarchaeia archaeon]
MHPKTKNINKFKAKIFNALADPIRLEILECLRSGEKCVCEIIPHVQVAQPLVSRHLAILKSCGIVKYRKDGNRRLYTIADQAIFRLIDSLSEDLVNTLSKLAIEQMV